MKRQRYGSVVMLLAAAALLAGCRGNPSVRKMRYLDSGERFSAQGKYREAAIQFMNALKVDRNFSEAHYELAGAYEHMDQFNAASSELTRTVELQPANCRARIDLGNLLMASGETEEAQIQAKAVLLEQPKNPSAHALLSAIAASSGNNVLALSEIRRALELDPGRAAYHDNLALLESGDSASAASAEDEFKKAVTLDPGSVNAKLLLAAFYARKNRLAEAEKTSWEAVVTDPLNLSARANVAQIILKEGDGGRAEQVLRQASKDFANYPQGVCILADYYADSGQVSKAMAEYASLITEYPKKVSVQKGYIRVLIQTGNFTGARSALAAMMKYDSGDPETLALNAIVNLHDGNASGAANAVIDKGKSFSNDSFMQYWVGEAAEITGDPELAELSFRKAAALKPSALNAQRELAQIAIRRGDLSMLSDVAEETILAVPDFAGAYIWRGIVEMSHGEAGKAEVDFNKALSLAPQDWQAHLQLGKLRFTQKRFPEGVALLEQALLYNPGSEEAMRLIVGYDLYLDHPDRALARLNAQIVKNSKDSALYDLLAQLQIRSKNLEQAAGTAEKAVQLNPSDGEAVMLLAQIAAQRGQTSNALGTWEQWSDQHPNDAGALAVLGTLEESSGDIGKAESYYKKSLQIQPQQPVAANNLAYQMLLDGNMVDEALALAQTARQGMPDSPNTADTLAWAYYYKGTYEYARDLLEDAINAEPDSATMQYHLGMVYGKLQDNHMAAIHLKKAAILARDSQTAKEAQAALQELN